MSNNNPFNVIVRRCKPPPPRGNSPGILQISNAFLLLTLYQPTLVGNFGEISFSLYLSKKARSCWYCFTLRNCMTETTWLDMIGEFENSAPLIQKPAPNHQLHQSSDHGYQKDRVDHASLKDEHSNISSSLSVFMGLHYFLFCARSAQFANKNKGVDLWIFYTSGI